MSTGEWISIKVRLPEIDQPVLCFCKEGDISVAAVFNSRGFQVQKYPTSGNRSMVDYWANVTHWMPLPAKPQN